MRRETGEPRDFYRINKLKFWCFIEFFEFIQMRTLWVDFKINQKLKRCKKITLINVLNSALGTSHVATNKKRTLYPGDHLLEDSFILEYLFRSLKVVSTWISRQLYLNLRINQVVHMTVCLENG